MFTEYDISYSNKYNKKQNVYPSMEKRSIIHRRPEWYHRYHGWSHHAKINWSFLIAILTVFNLMVFGSTGGNFGHSPFIQSTNAASTTITQAVTAGSVALVSQTSASMSAVGINATTAQISTGNLGTTTVTDNRGSGAGWSVTATATSFYVINGAVKTSGSNNSVASGGIYSGITGGTYTVTIATGGAAGVATYTVGGVEAQAATTTGNAVVIGTKGVTATFAAATYITGDSWTIRVDTIPVTSLTLTPPVLTTVAGSSSGVTVGGAHTYTGVSDPATLMTATSGNGMGSYSTNPTLVLSVPAATYANNYTATIIETAS